MYKKINKLAAFPLIIFVYIYKLLLSPILKTNCRFLPSCSEYTLIALKEHGLTKGIYLSLIRILSCHPLGGSGYDPVPKINSKNK